jgi:hypothetical protein
MRFWIVWGFDAGIALVVLVFFCWGLSDGTVSSFNFGLWMAMLAGVGGVVGGSLWLRSKGRPRGAMAIAMILFVPGLLYALFLLAVLILHPRWN